MSGRRTNHFEQTGPVLARSDAQPLAGPGGLSFARMPMTVVERRRWHSMKRRLLTLLIFLLAGAVVNVAVAWVIAIHLPKSKPSASWRTTWSAHQALDRVRLEDPKFVAWWADHAPQGFPRNADMASSSSPGFGASALTASAGSFEIQPEGVFRFEGVWVSRLRAGWPLRSMEGARWWDDSGLLRVRRGLCPQCAYPMGESAVCSECGKPLPKAT